MSVPLHIPSWRGQGKRTLKDGDSKAVVSPRIQRKWAFPQGILLQASFKLFGCLESVKPRDLSSAGVAMIISRIRKT
jgi:hypothetical protein